MRIIGFTAFTLLCYAVAASAQANGHLQIHYLNVGQGDATLIISPLGETMLIDSGPFSASNCAGPTGIVTQLTAIGLTHLDYHVASHYDDDHIGCSDHVLARWPVQRKALDRGTLNPPSTQTYTRYVDAVPAIQRHATEFGQDFWLDEMAAAPVRLEVVGVNGNGAMGSLTERDRSIVLALHFGRFDAVFGGDLTGDAVHDIEGVVAPTTRESEVYKVHDHGGATSSSGTWMAVVHPKVAILSVGNPNALAQPTQAALDRIRAVGAITYWTTAGSGAPAQAPYDIVANGTVSIDAAFPALEFTVTHEGMSDTYMSWDSERETRQDYENDEKTEVAVFRPSSGSWFFLASSFGYTASAHHSWGIEGDIPLSADFDGDGLSDLVAYRPSVGTWFIAYSSLGWSVTNYGVFHWGGFPDDVPMPGDYDADGKADIALYRRSNGTWVIRFSSLGYSASAYGSFGGGGTPGDIPLTGDFDADGRTDRVIVRPAHGTRTWFVATLSGGQQNYAYQWGAETDLPVSGDFDGDTQTDLAVYRPSTGAWYIRFSSQAYSYSGYASIEWGQPGDQPTIGDFDGDGKSEITVYRPSTGQWFVLFSSQGYSASSYGVYQWGTPDDTLIK